MNLAKGPEEKFFSTDVVFLLKDIQKGKQPPISLEREVKTH